MSGGEERNLLFKFGLAIFGLLISPSGSSCSSDSE